MEIFLLMALAGVITYHLLSQREERPDPLQDEQELSPRMTAQWENFFSYDGTAENQKDIEEAEDGR